MQKLEIVEKVRQILKSHCEDPADQIIKEGETLVAIGKALKGLGLHEARAVMRAVSDFESV